jgi:superfamily II DNA or RNA helicase
VARTGQALRRVRRVLLVLPPGGGKTVIAAFIAQAFAARGQQTFFNCHRAELLKQTSGTFHNCNLPHSFIAAGMPMYVDASVQVCSIDTLKNRVLKLKEPKVVIWDECHHIGAAGWAAIMKAWPNAYHIGLTGTPWRLDGTGLGEYFDEMVIGPTPAELIAWGNLAPYRIFAPSAPDMKGVRKQFKDFDKKETEKRMREPKLTGDIIKHWNMHARGMRTIGYAMTVPHSMYMVDLMRQAGIRAAHLDGGTDDTERRRVIKAYADGELDVLWNVGLFGEGFDLSAWAGKPVTIDAGILANPTMSLSKYLQEAMRPMRPAPDKVAIILDHAGNCQRHGFPDDERDWSLEGNGGAGRKAANDNAPPPPVTCEGCFMQIRRPLPPKCPHCDKKLFADFVAPDVKDEELREQTEAMKRETRMRLKREQAEAKTLDELVALGRRRKYKDPIGWARKVYAGRMAVNRRAA